jgi:hypothetical protein
LGKLVNAIFGYPFDSRLFKDGRLIRNGLWQRIMLQIDFEWVGGLVIEFEKVSDDIS